MGKITVLGFAGSLRKDSYNKAILRAAVELAPKKMLIEVFDLEGIPPFNQDLESRIPKRVKEFKAKIKGRRRDSDRHARVQLLDTRSSKECD